MIDSTMDFYNSEYSQQKGYINDARSKGKSWEEINFCSRNDEKGLVEFLKNQELNSYWSITSDTWHLLVSKMKAIEQKQSCGYIGKPKTPLKDTPDKPFNLWTKYRLKLEKKGTISDIDIAGIEKSAIRVVSSFQAHTPQSEPIRGVVFGNIQSGKTANMAAVIAMAADYDFNFFIVLSGTIESLRIQTRDRLISDLTSSDGFCGFEILDHLCSNNIEKEKKLQNLYLGPNSSKKYLTVCLKNSSWLKNLLGWLNSDDKAKMNLRIVLIDDEADQAGINTKNIDRGLQSTISQQIKDIVFARSSNNLKALNYQCMNYVGYTATPYANFLNEANDSSLYPKNFIVTLPQSNQYIGPKEIFGVPDENPGLPIVNEIPNDEIDVFNKHNYSVFPIELERALEWFVCTVASARFYKLSKPVSMLIHTSQNVGKHEEMAQLITSMFEYLREKDDFLYAIEQVWNEETSMLDEDNFANNVKNYTLNQKIRSYPRFCDIKDEIIKIISLGFINIKLDEENQKITYGDGIHLCIDNCRTMPDDENIVLRLIYPEKKDVDTLSKCPAFIVIGGNTLSRGLTIEGLTCTYFLRSSSMGDSTMQMGRWFGYRKNYELLPRLWLSKNGIQMFCRLAKLDFDLREELCNMESMNISPSEYGPKLDTFPDYARLKITNKNKMQHAKQIKGNPSNKSDQTTIFFNDEDIISNNFNKTVTFIENLGQIEIDQIKKLNNDFTNDKSLIWFDKDYNCVFDFLKELKFPHQNALFNDFDAVKEWFKGEFDHNYLTNFNIIVSSLKDNDSKNHNMLRLSNCDICLPSRKKVIPKNDEENKYIDLKVITSPNDRLLDIDETLLSSADREYLRNHDKDSKFTYAKARMKYNLSNTPLLVIYVIDKDNGIKLNDETPIQPDSKRMPLGIKNHLVGYYIYIPYGNNGNIKSTANSSYTVNLEFDTKEDIDVTDD